MECGCIDRLIERECTLIPLVLLWYITLIVVIVHTFAGPNAPLAPPVNETLESY